MKHLVVVESPTKAKTLSRFLGNEYVILASYGHIRDLPKKKLGVDIDNGFKPQYQALSDKKKVVKKIIEAVKDADEVILATDPDREGEAIAYHLKYLIEQKVKKIKVKRITFHEITAEAINSALKNPGDVDLSLFEAQQARRVLDRLVGYKLSPLLWRKVRKGLSAGRVQSVAVRLICEREDEIRRFVPQEYWLIEADFVKNKSLKLGGFELVRLHKAKPKIGSEKELKEVVRDLKQSGYEISKLQIKEVKKSSMPPLVTSTMQQMASTRFGFSAHRTMRAAQALYEKGLITYHRTDSVHLSAKFVDEARRFIKKSYGDAYVPVKKRIFKTKSRVAQEAHEAIRPTRVDVTYDSEKIKRLGADEIKVYSLIWLKAVMSQMADWKGKQTLVEVADKKGMAVFRNQGVVEVFDGWRRLYWQGREDKKIEFIEGLKVGDQVELADLRYEQKFTSPPNRYGDAGLIKVLEEKGIGRPSTYASILQKIQQRGYVEKEERRFVPTFLGEAVTEFLVKYFPEVMDYEFTAKMEGDLDLIAAGRKKWLTVVSSFWSWFAPQIEKVLGSAKRVKVKVEKTGEKCPECKAGELVVRVGRYGKFLACSNFPECSYTREYVQKTKWKCPECDGEVIVKKTKKGRKFYGCSNYPKCKWGSWRKPRDLKEQSD